MCWSVTQNKLKIRSVQYISFFQIMLRVKESEVQCLKQEAASLKDELQSALKVSIPHTVQLYNKKKVYTMFRNWFLLHHRTRGTQQKSTRTHKQSWASSERKRSERPRSWGRTCGWLTRRWEKLHSDLQLHFLISVSAKRFLFNTMMSELFIFRFYVNSSFCLPATKNFFKVTHFFKSCWYTGRKWYTLIYFYWY